jgi:ABC-type transport system involved in multi-copper enzyme maturation permease subunit
MVRRFLRQKLHNAGVVVALAALALLVGVQLAASGGESGFEAAVVAVFVLAAAAVSRDATSGALQMILSRPISRSSYLLGRFVGVLAGYALFVLAACAFALAVSRALPLVGAGAPSAPLAWAPLARGAAGSMLGALGAAAPMLLLSTFLPGYGDVLGFILLPPLLSLPALAAPILNAPVLEKAGNLLRRNLLPSVDWAEALSVRGVLSESVGRWVFATVAYVALAIVLFNRREFAYGQD